MAEAIKVSRAINAPLAERLTELIQETITEAEAESSWRTFTIELQFEAGKLKTLRRSVNETWKDGATGPANGEVLTQSRRRA